MKKIKCITTLRKLWSGLTLPNNLAMSLPIIIMVSCSDDDGPTQVPINTGVLTVSQAEVVIDNDKITEEAIRFSWHAEKTSIIQYKLVLTAGAKIDSVNVSSEVSKIFTHAEFNVILVDKLQLEIGKVTNITAMVYAKAKSSGKTGSSNVITVSVTPTTKVPEPPLESVTLSAPKSEAVIDIANPEGETVSFLWGSETNTFIQYKLTLTSGAKSETLDVLNDVGKEFTNTELNTILVDKLQLETGKAANMDVVVHAKVIISGKEVTSNTLTISVTPSAKGAATPAYDKLWIVGNATPNGWNIGDPNMMANDPTNIYQFKYNEVLNSGEFKIPVTTGNWGCDYYMPSANHPDVSSTNVTFIAGGNPDNKWNIEHAGAYKILLNISGSPFIKITPFTPYAHIYILGDATSAGWDANNPIEMTVDPNDPNVFTWTGELKSTGRGQFRFPVATGDSNKSFFVAPSSGANLTDTQIAFTDNGTPANNFRVKAGEDGVYQITINQLKETISIVKQ